MIADRIAQFFKQDELSDLDIVIKLRPAADREGQKSGSVQEGQQQCCSPAEECLAQFPAHRLVLFAADYFKAQANRVWAPTSDTGEAAAPPAVCSRPLLHLTIDSAEQLPAAEAVIASLYGVSDALSSLQQEQLVCAAVTADKIGAADVIKQSMSMLQAAAKQADGISAATMEALASLTVWPACLQPLLLPVIEHASCCDDSLTDLAAILAADTGSRVQRMLLAVLGDLDAVWRDEQLHVLLLQLPLPAMQLLLSSDQLRVVSEDMVLYTATQHTVGFPSHEQQPARAALAQLVHAQHLSRAALAGQALSSSPDLLLSCYSKQLRSLVSCKLVTSGDTVPAEALDSIADLPAAWRLGQRQLVANDDVRLTWRLPVEELAAACRKSFAGNKAVTLESPTQSALVAGGRWNLMVDCMQEEEQGVSGTVVGVFVELFDMPPDEVLYVYKCTLACNGESRELACPGAQAPARAGYLLDVGPMSAGGGWDEAAWAAAGLPVAGELLLGLTMHSVG